MLKWEVRQFFLHSLGGNFWIPLHSKVSSISHFGERFHDPYQRRRYWNVLFFLLITVKVLLYSSSSFPKGSHDHTGEKVVWKFQMRRCGSWRVSCFAITWKWRSFSFLLFHLLSSFSLKFHSSQRISSKLPCQFLKILQELVPFFPLIIERFPWTYFSLSSLTLHYFISQNFHSEGNFFGLIRFLNLCQILIESHRPEFPLL